MERKEGGVENYWRKFLGTRFHSCGLTPVTGQAQCYLRGPRFAWDPPVDDVDDVDEAGGPRPNRARPFGRHARWPASRAGGLSKKRRTRGFSSFRFSALGSQRFYRSGRTVSRDPRVFCALSSASTSTQGNDNSSTTEQLHPGRSRRKAQVNNSSSRIHMNDSRNVQPAGANNISRNIRKSRATLPPNRPPSPLCTYRASVHNGGNKVAVAHSRPIPAARPAGQP